MSYVYKKGFGADSIRPLIDRRLVRSDPLLFENAGWAPVPPAGLETGGPVPTIASRLSVEMEDSVALPGKLITQMPLESQMAQADKALIGAFDSLTRETASEAPYQPPPSDIRFTDPYRDPNEFLDVPERPPAPKKLVTSFKPTLPDMEPDISYIPSEEPHKQMNIPAYEQEKTLTELPVEPTKEIGVPAKSELFNIPKAPKAPDTIDIEGTTTSIPVVGDVYGPSGTALPNVPSQADVGPVVPIQVIPPTESSSLPLILGGVAVLWLLFRK
jgi:hypothetical protein